MKQELFKKILTEKLPIAWIAGLRLEESSSSKTTIGVELDFLNQNPFESMFWAVQGMAAELAGGLLVMEAIQKLQKNIASLVVNVSADFTKKATGKILFSCEQGELVSTKIEEAAASGQPIIFKLESIGTDLASEIVSKFTFTWSVKLRAN